MKRMSVSEYCFMPYVWPDEEPAKPRVPGVTCGHRGMSSSGRNRMRRIPEVLCFLYRFYSSTGPCHLSHSSKLTSKHPGDCLPGTTDSSSSQSFNTDLWNTYCMSGS